MIDNEDIDQATHCATHTQWTEYERPQDLVEEVPSASHDEDTNGEENDFGKDRCQPEEDERTEIDNPSFLGDFDIRFASDNWLVGVCCHYYG